MEAVSSWLSEFLRSDSNALKIKAYQGVGVGFVDGEILILLNTNGAIIIYSEYHISKSR